MKEEIVEGNRLIAIFMGGVFKQDIAGDISTLAWQFKEEPPETFSINIYDEDLKYHNSWDWQIPVWVRLHEKVKNYSPKEPTIRPRPLHADYDKAIESNNIFFQYHKFRESWKHRALEDNNTIAAFEILVKAIQWYNQNRKPA